MPRIIKNFAQTVVANVEAAQKKIAAKSSIDHKAALEKLIGKNLEKMEVGDGMELPLPKVEGMTGQKYLATLRGKFVPATREGEVFAGRVYKLKVKKAIEDKPETVLLWRDPDLATPKGKKVGGRKAGTPNKPKEGETVVAAGQTESAAPNIAEAKAAAQAHLGTTEPASPKVEPEVKAATAKKGGTVKDLTAKKDVTTA